jgi:hypothetical protein
MVIGQFAQDTTVSFSTRPSSMSIRAGRIISGLLIVFLIQDALIKVLNLDFAVEATVELGYSERLVVPIGITLLACTVLYAVPRTAVFGAILLTGYLGGAIATSVRLEEGVWFLFPAAFALLVWLGLYLRDSRIRALLES